MTELESKFFQIVKMALYTENYDMAKNLFYIQEYLGPELEILYTDNIEIMELVVRTLTRADLDFKLKLQFTVLNCPENEREFVEWFVKFFALIESLAETGYNFTKEHDDILYHEYSPYSGTIYGMFPNYETIPVLIHVSCT